MYVDSRTVPTDWAQLMVTVSRSFEKTKPRKVMIRI